MPTTAFTSEPSTVTVTGTATATAVPDIVRLTIGVSVTQTAVSDAFDAVARLSTALTETLHARGVRGADLTTAGLSVHPQTHWSDGGRQETTGFTASTTFRVVLRELEPEAANSPLPSSRHVYRWVATRFGSTDWSSISTTAAIWRQEHANWPGRQPNRRPDSSQTWQTKIWSKSSRCSRTSTRSCRCADV